MYSESLVLLRRGTDPGDPYSYTINSVDVEDTGLYSCVAGNILGETVNIAHLEVNRGQPASHRGQDQPHHPSDKTESQSFSLVNAMIQPPCQLYDSGNNELTTNLSINLKS